MILNYRDKIKALKREATALHHIQHMDNYSTSTHSAAYRARYVRLFFNSLRKEYVKKYAEVILTILECDKRRLGDLIEEVNAIK